MSSTILAGPALLFCPADRPDRFTKALDRADAVILDLEDAVAATARPMARDAIAHSRLDPSRVIVRVNAIGTADYEADLHTIAGTEYRTIMVPKADAGLLQALPAGYSVIALCETAAGILAAQALAAADGIIALMWGAEDLVASVGGTSSRSADGHYRDVAAFARSHVLIAAAAAGIAAIDAVHLDIADLDGLRDEATDAAASGFTATACIHPSHVPIVRAAYRPSAAQLDWARRVLAAADSHEGVFTLDGAMVDEPVLRHAEATLRRS